MDIFQKQFVEPPDPGTRRNYSFITGRGFGKTMSACLTMTRYAAEGIAHDMLLIIPTYSLAKIEYAPTFMALEEKYGYKAPRLLTGDTNQWIWDYPELDYPRCTVKSADGKSKHSSRGLNLDLLMMDETAYFVDLESVYEAAKPALRKGIMQEISYTTPPVDAVRAKTYSMLKQIHENAEVKVSGKPCDNPHNHGGWCQTGKKLGPCYDRYLESQTNPDRWKIDHDGLLLENPRYAVFNTALIERRALPPKSHDTIIIGVDPTVTTGRQAGDECGIVVISTEWLPQKSVHVLEDWSGYPSTTSSIRQILKSIYDRYREEGYNVVFKVETNQGQDYLLDLMGRYDYPAYTFTTINHHTSKRSRFEVVAEWYSTKEVTHAPGLDKLEAQMNEWTPLPSGRHDDRVDALSIAITTVFGVR